MEGYRRLSFCAFADHFPDPLSDCAGKFQGKSGGGWRRSWAGWRRWGRIGWREAAIHRTEDSGARCYCSGSHSQAGGSSKAGSHASPAHSSPADGICAASAKYCSECRDGNWYCRHRRRWPGERGWNRVGNRNRHWKRERARNRGRSRYQLSADSDSVLSPSAACAVIGERLSPHRVLRCGREGKREAAWIQSVA